MAAAGEPKGWKELKRLSLFGWDKRSGEHPPNRNAANMPEVGTPSRAAYGHHGTLRTAPSCRCLKPMSYLRALMCAAASALLCVLVFVRCIHTREAQLADVQRPLVQVKDIYGTPTVEYGRRRRTSARQAESPATPAPSRKRAVRCLLPWLHSLTLYNGCEEPAVRLYSV